MQAAEAGYRVNRSAAAIDQVPDAMPEPVAAALETRQRTILGTRHVARLAGEILERRFGIEDFPHVLGVWLPVGGKMKFAAGDQLARHQAGEPGLHDAPLVVPFLRPW